METKQTQNWFLKISKFLTYLTFFILPIFFLPFTIAPVEINKFFIFAILILFSFIFYIINSIVSKKIIYPTSFLSFPIIFLIAVAGISAIFSKYKSLSFYGNLSLPDSFLAVFLCGIFYFLSAIHFESKDAKFLSWLFFASFSIVALISVFQFSELFLFQFDFAENNNFNTIGTIGALGLFISLGFVIILSLLSFTKTDEEMKLKNITKIWLKKIILNLLAILCLLIIFLTNLKLIWIQIAIILIFLLIYQIFSKQKIFSKNNSALLTYAIIFMILYFYSFHLTIPSKFPTEIRPNLQSTFLVLTKSLQNQNFVIGSGPSTFTYNWMLYRPIELNNTDYWSMRFTQGFNYVLTLASTLGILGIFSFIFLFFTFLFLCKKISTENKTDFIIFVSTFYLIITLFFYPSNLTLFGFLFFGLGLISSISGTKKEINLNLFSRKTTIGLLILIFIVFVLLIQTLKIYFANIYYASAIKNWEEKNIENSIIYLEKAKKSDSSSSLYSRELSKILFSIDLDSALQNAQKSIEIEPYEPLNWINISRIYSSLITISAQFRQAAISGYQKAIELDPYNNEIKIELNRILSK